MTKLRTGAVFIGIAAFLSSAATAAAQNPPSAPRDQPTPVPDLGGLYPVVMEMDVSLPNHTIYRPADLDAVDGPLPVVAYGAGGCFNGGNVTPQFLGELASRGYLVVAGGPIIDGLDPARSPTAQANGQEQIPQSRTAHMFETIDWVIAQNEVTGGRFQQRIASDRIAVVGHSCGGLQAIAAADDPRVTTAIIGNSGIIRTPPVDATGTGRSYRPAGVDDLKRISAPTLYVSGGPTDQAQPNAFLDFDLINAPLFHGDIDTGHGGTYRQPRGGEYAQVMGDWLDWRLKGDAEAGKTFAGPDCRLCNDPRWTVQKKGLD